LTKSRNQLASFGSNILGVRMGRNDDALHCCVMDIEHVVRVLVQYLSEEVKFPRTATDDDKYIGGVIRIKVSGDGTVLSGGLRKFLLSAIQIIKKAASRYDDRWASDKNSVKHCLLTGCVIGDDSTSTIHEYLGKQYERMKYLRDNGIVIDQKLYKVVFIHAADMKYLASLSLGDCTKNYCMQCNEHAPEMNRSREACTCCITRGRPRNKFCRHRAMFDPNIIPLHPTPPNGCKTGGHFPVYPSHPRKLSPEEHREFHRFVGVIVSKAKPTKKDLEEATICWLNQCHVSLSSMGHDGIDADHWYISSAPHENVRKQLMLRYSSDNLRQLFTGVIAEDIDECERDLLRETLQYEQLVSRCSRLREKRLIDPCECVCCVLHLFGRTSEIIFKQLFCDVMEMSRSHEERLANIERVDSKLREVVGSSKTKIINIVNLKGCKGARATYSLDFKRAKRLIQHYEEILRVCFPESERGRKRVREDEDQLNRSAKCRVYTDWVELLKLFQVAMHDLRQLTEFTEEQIDTMQDHFDAFGDKYIDMFGIQRVTQYIHQMISGHIRDHVIKYGPLALISNQGIEYLMGEVKRYVLRKSLRGGCRYSLDEDIMKEYVLKFLYRCNKNSYIDPLDCYGSLSTDFKEWLDRNVNMNELPEVDLVEVDIDHNNDNILDAEDDNELIEQDDDELIQLLEEELVFD
jgi:hypothetical protein